MATVTVLFAGEKIAEYPVGDVVVIGRGAECDIPIDNLAVSRTHCQIVTRGNTYVLQDTNSASGTYVNGRKIDEHYLNDGDEILVGKHTLAFDARRTIAPPRQEQTHPGDSAPVERTYIMSPELVRERLAEMRAAAPGAPGGGPEPEAVPPSRPGLPPPPAGLRGALQPRPMTAQQHAHGMDPLTPRMPHAGGAGQRGHTGKHAAAAPGGGLKAFLMLSLATNVVLILLIVVLILLMTGIIPQPTR